MAWNLTDELFIRNTNNHTIGGHKYGTKYSKENELFNVLSKLKEFRDEKIFCDFVFNVKNTKFYAHKALVASWSPKLASLLQSEQDASGLMIKTDDTKAVETCLDYMYTGYVTPDDTNIHALLELSRTLMIDSLVSSCETYLQKNVGLQNFVSKYFLSLKFNLNVLEEVIVSFIETNIGSIIEQPGLLNLQPSDFKSFLTTGKMKELKQDARFSLIISWVGFNISDREKYLMYLFERVNWTHSINDLLIKISCTQNIFTTNEFCLFQLLHSLVTAMGHHLGPFITTYPRLFAIYSHMIEDLSHPEAFSEPGQYHQQFELVEFAVINRTPVTVETAVNTDFEYDLSAFQEAFIPIESTESTEETCLLTSSSIEENTDIVKSETDMGLTSMIDPSGIESLEKNGVEDITTGETTLLSVTHRRKSLPRKLPQKSNAKEPKERKRKQKKQSSKEKDVSKAVKQNADNETKHVTKEEVDLIKDDTMDYIVTNNSVETTGEDHKPDGTENNGENNMEHVKNDIVEHKPKSTIKLTLKRGRPASLKKTKSKSKVSNSQRLSRAVSGTNAVTKPSRQRQRVYCTYENCDFSAKLAHVLEKHVERVHLVSVSLSCWKCEFKTTEMRELCQHLKEHFPQSPFCCEYENCNLKFLRLGLLVKHHMTHMQERPYQCDFCLKSFVSYNQLSCHKKLHSGPQFECDVCFRKFGTKGVMQQHRAIHFDNKPYLCDLCGFSTKHQSHLISHRKIHTGDVKRCTFPNCNYSTPKAGHMTQHMNSHLNIRNHICQVCGKSFVVRGKLLRHERIHLKEKLYKCKQCDYQTSRTDRMKLHIESHGIKLKRKSKSNVPGFEFDDEPEIDFHQLYEKVHPDDDSSLPTQVSLTSSNQIQTIPYLSISDIKPMDVISFAASTSMIMDNYNTSRLTIDPLNPTNVACMEDIQAAATYQQNFERMTTTAFDQL